MRPNIRAAQGRCRRVYIVHVMGPGCHFEVWPGFEVHSTARIRWFAVDFFRRWFGRVPDDRLHTWHKDGFMAEARCRRGFTVQVEQVNYAILRPVRAPRYRDSRALTVIDPSLLARGKERAA